MARRTETRRHYRHDGRKEAKRLAGVVGTVEWVRDVREEFFRLAVAQHVRR
jgi:hypothetical protein